MLVRKQMKCGSLVLRKPLEGAGVLLDDHHREMVRLALGCGWSGVSDVEFRLLALHTVDTLALCGKNRCYF